MTSPISSAFPVQSAAPRVTWWRFVPAFLLPPVFFACGWFWGPPLLFSDTATGLLAWHNFVQGGSWNTIIEPSAANLALNIEQPITWWSPGQYVPLGLLVSAGLPLGAAMLLLALCSAWSLTAGLVCFARELEAPASTLPWVALTAAGSWHTLYAFGMFIGGEVVLIALFPWIILAGWRLREHPVLRIILLPPLLLLGSFAKHSFAIYALGLIAFLWLETLRGRPRSLRSCISATLPFITVGMLYLVGRHLVFASGPMPSDPGQLHRTAAESFGFSALGPVLAATGGGSLAGRVFTLLGLPFEIAWQRLAPALVLLAPFCLALYTWLALSSRPLERLAGIIALVAVAILALLLWRGGSISLEDRHFRPAGVLLMAVYAVLAFAAELRVRVIARGVLLFTLIFGIAAAFQRHYSLSRHVYAAGDHSAIADLTPAAQAELRHLDKAAGGTNAILYLSRAELSALVHSARLIVTDASDHNAAWLAAQPRHGRVALLTLVLPATFDQDGRGSVLRASFIDYPAAVWTCHSVDGWDFWQAGPSPSSTQ